MNVLSVLGDVEEAVESGSKASPPGGAGQGLYGLANARSQCNCSRNNSLLFETRFEDVKSGACGQDKSREACLMQAREKEINGIRFGTDYGTQCAVFAREESRNRNIMTLTLPGLLMESSRLNVARLSIFLYQSTCWISWFVRKRRGV
jgi:hypothetical protein